MFFLTQALLPRLADSGRIVNLSSGLMTRVSYPGYSAYAAVKGAIETDFGGGAVRDNPEINQIFAAMTALGRAGLPDHIAR